MNAASSKNALYDALVERRKGCTLCKDQLCNPSKINSYSAYDWEIGPWSRWQGSLDADLMIVGQDWGNEKLLQENYMKEDGNEMKITPTDKNLLYLINGISATKIDWNLRGRAGDFFFTNAVLCLRCGDLPLQDKVRDAWLNNCVGEMKFLRKQIEVVNPKVVVGLGEIALNSILRSFDLKPRKIGVAVNEKDGIELPGTRAKVFAVYHCGARITNMTRTLDEQVGDWERIRHALAN